MDEQPIKSWLHAGELGNLIQQLEYIQALDAAIQPLLPEAFQAVCRVKSVSQGCVILSVPNASILTLLRYEIPNILAELRKERRWAGIASIKGVI